MANTSFCFTHTFSTKSSPTKNDIYNLLYKVANTFYKLDLGKVYKVDLLNHYSKSEDSKTVEINIEIEMNMDNLAALKIYNKVYNNQSSVVCSCAKVVYDDPKTWVLWRGKCTDDFDDSYSVMLQKDSPHQNKQILISEWTTGNIIPHVELVEDDDEQEEEADNSALDSSTVKLYEDWANELVEEDNGWGYEQEANKEKMRFYEDWAKELDRKYKEERVQYKYDHLYMIYSPDSEKAASCGYLAHSKKEFEEFYGLYEGNLYWSSPIYSSHAYYLFENVKSNQELPPKGCMFNNNISILNIRVDIDTYEEYSFNVIRTFLRKYVDDIYQLSDPTDDSSEQPPPILLLANLNEQYYSLSCRYDYHFTNLKEEKRKTVSKLISNLKEDLEECGCKTTNMFRWF